MLKRKKKQRLTLTITDEHIQPFIDAIEHAGDMKKYAESRGWSEEQISLAIHVLHTVDTEGLPKILRHMES